MLDLCISISVKIYWRKYSVRTYCSLYTSELSLDNKTLIISETNKTDPKVSVIFDKVYENFVEEVDAIDNGINVAEGKQRYAISTNLSSRVGYCNPHWNETCSSDEIDQRFQQAMQLAGGEFMQRVKFYSDIWWPARELVEMALNKRFEVKIWSIYLKKYIIFPHLQYNHDCTCTR